MKKTLVFGLDGATFTLLKPLMDLNIMPYLKSYENDGVTSVLKATFPPITVPGWLCISSGMDPGSIGIFDFYDYAPPPALGKPSIKNINNKMIWDYFSRWGYKSAVINFPYYLPFKLKGVFVGGMLVSKDRYTYPDNFREDISKNIGNYMLDLDLDKLGIKEHVDKAILSVQQKVKLAKYIIDKDHPSFLFVIFTETDRLQHRLWQYMDKSYPKKEDIGNPEDIYSFWKILDGSMKEIEKSFFGNDYGNTFIVSDHGSGPIYKTFYINEWLLQNGYIKLKIKENKSSKIKQYIHKVARNSNLINKIFTQAKGGRLFRSLESLAQKTNFETNFADVQENIDWKETIAYDFPIKGGIYLNRLAKFYSNDKQKDNIIKELRKKLESVKGVSLKTYTPQEVYKGKNIDTCPDIFVVGDNFSTEIIMPFTFGNYILEYPRYKTVTGSHRMEGIFFSKGVDINKGIKNVDISMVDITPTILKMNNIPFSNLDGKICKEIIKN